jgi:hypothetical protein
MAGSVPLGRTKMALFVVNQILTPSKRVNVHPLYLLKQLLLNLGLLFIWTLNFAFL